MIDWTPGEVVVSSLSLNCDDEHAVHQVLASDKAGLDCPLGWPEPFVDFVVAHRDGSVEGPVDAEVRRELRYRETDRAVQELGAAPLSVSSDRICVTAMRTAGLLARLERELGDPVDRAGSGRVVEVYPAAALRSWKLVDGPYKGAGRRTSLAALVDRLAAKLPTLRLGEWEQLVRRSDDAFDAVICALVARAATCKGGVTVPKSVEQQRRAVNEGWIAVPTMSLASLVD